MEPKLVLLGFIMLTLVPQGLSSNQSEFFALMKASLSGNGLSDWDLTGGKPVCNLPGVTCNSHGLVEGLNVSGWQLKGQFPDKICSYLPVLRVLDLSRNSLAGNFLNGVFNCSLLEVFNLNSNYLRAPVPDFSRMQSLRLLNMSYNLFTGKFPVSFTNLTNLQVFDLNENPELDLWKLPENISKLKKLQIMVLSTCRLQGPIPRSIGNMTALVELHLAGNFLSGPIPRELGLVKNLQQLYLYYNFFLSGSLPEELGNLTELVEMDISVNQLTGSIPESVCRLPNLQVLQIYNNSLSGQIPKAIENSTTLTLLSLYDNYLTGQVPQFVGHLSPLIILELSENNLTGPLPSEACRGGKLQYFLLLDNKLTGKIPDSYQNCKSLVRFRISKNHLVGSIPQGLLALPHVSIIDLATNNLSGPVPSSIVKAGNLSELFLQSNQLSGVLPPEICGAITLVKIDLSNNFLSGPVPSEIGNLKRLNLLMLQGNKLNSSIPATLSLLKSLNVLDLSNNLLTGKIPECLTELLPNSINFANNQLSGLIPLSFIKGGVAESFLGNPGLCVEEDVKADVRDFPICSRPKSRKRLNTIWAIGIPSLIVMIGALLFLKRRLSKGRPVMEHDDQTLSSSFFSYTVKSFHRLSFHQSEILEALIDKNIVGQGGSGTVYRIQLSSGEAVAVKKLWSQRTKDSSTEDQLAMDKGLKTEVETLGSIRHKNIVKLFSYFSGMSCNLLVYEYMPNGNLWDALHKGRIHLDWPTRHQIALGVAQGLAYLHHDLVRPIIHRDIKSTNILLDVNHQPKVADFGIAKVLQARGKDSTTTVVAGTYGYLAPEYAYSNKATTKCDVYSFGVVLMELITGKKPVEADFGENKNIVYWVSTKADTQRVMEVLDKKLSESFSNEMKEVLRIAMRCTNKNPAQRPTMTEVIQLLLEADSCGFDCCKLSKKSKEAATKTKDASDL